MRYGWNATSYQLLNPGMRHWFNAGGDAVVGYVSTRKTWVVAGSPVCAHEELEYVANEFESAAKAAGKRVCYFGAGERLKACLDRKRGYASIVIGTQPAWRAAEWATVMQHNASLRGQVNRARNKAVIVTEWSAAVAAHSPVLRAVLNQWLKTRTLPSLHFLAEPQTLSRLYDRRIFVATRMQEAIGFVVLTPIPCRSGWLTEQFVRGDAAVNGTMELLVDTAVRQVVAEGAAYITMGLTPLAQHTVEMERNPPWLDLTMRRLRAHGHRFYNFNGLESFKGKFKPHVWEPVWVVSAENRFSTTTLWDIAAAFGHQPPLRLLLRGIWRAAQQEILWAGKAISK